MPAAAARNLAHGTRQYLLWSVASRSSPAPAASAISTQLLVPTGGAVVLAVSVIFFVTLIIGRVVRRQGARGRVGP